MIEDNLVGNEPGVAKNDRVAIRGIGHIELDPLPKAGIDIQH